MTKTFGERRTLMPLMLTLAIATGCAQAPAAVEPPPGRASREWGSALLLDVGEGIGVGGVATGDFDPSASGLEVAALAEDGRVAVIRHEGDGWRERVIHKGAGELIQCRAVSMKGGQVGIAAVGMTEGTESDTGGPGLAVLLLPMEEGNEFGVLRSWTFPRCGHGVAAADLLPGQAGPEIAAADFGGQVAICAWETGKMEVIHHGGDRAKALVCADLSSGGEGLEIVCAYASGEVVLIERKAQGYEGKTIYRRAPGAARLAAGDVDPRSPGPEIVCGFDDGVVAVIRGAGDRWVGREVLKAPKKIRGVAVGELDPSREGPEIAAAAKDGTVRIVREGDPAGQVVFQAARPLHDLAAADILPDRPGDELVTAGYGGKVWLLHR